MSQQLWHDKDLYLLKGHTRSFCIPPSIMSLNDYSTINSLKPFSQSSSSFPATLFTETYNLIRRKYVFPKYVFGFFKKKEINPDFNVLFSTLRHSPHPRVIQFTILVDAHILIRTTGTSSRPICPI